ncbi:unnamed protein product [Musa acuminata var. zebrina]
MKVDELTNDAEISVSSYEGAGLGRPRRRRRHFWCLCRDIWVSSSGARHLQCTRSPRPLLRRHARTPGVLPAASTGGARLLARVERTDTSPKSEVRCSWRA